MIWSRLALVFCLLLAACGGGGGGSSGGGDTGGGGSGGGDTDGSGTGGGAGGGDAGGSGTGSGDTGGGAGGGNTGGGDTGGGGGDVGGGGGTGGTDSGGAAGGGTGTGPPPVVEPDPRLARLDQYRAQTTRVLGSAATGAPGISPSVGAMPAQGLAQFEGFGSLRVEQGQGLVLFGDARLVVDFGTSQVSGGMDRFFGSASTSAVVDYDGVITITGQHADQVLQLDYAGALTGADQTLVVTGQMQGAFLGDPVVAISALDLDSRVVLDGQVQTATMLMVLEAAGQGP